MRRKLRCVVVGAEADGAALRVSFATVRGYPSELEDRVPLGPPGAIAAVKGIGRLLRIFRAGRVSLPPDPYALGVEPERAAELVLRCQGALVELEVERHIERALTVWTDAGVESIVGVLDYLEDSEGLSIQRTGGSAPLKIARENLIRFAPSSSERLEVVSVEIPARGHLR